jgi:DNA repair exonuclease SbcCD ATPase subunit
MKLQLITAEYFRGFRDKTEVQIHDGINVVLGENGSGKSSLLNSIEWCLFGRDVEKSATGISERSNWEVPWRNGQQTDTVVELKCDSKEGSFSVCRTRKAGSKSTTPDEFRLDGPDNPQLSGEEAESWIKGNGFPHSFQDWQSAYCQHQEAARLRVTQKSVFDNALATLIGLEDIVKFRHNLAAIKTTNYITALQKSEDIINTAFHDQLDNNSALDKAKEALAEHGLEPGKVTLESANEVAAKIRELAESWTALLELKLGKDKYQISESIENIGEFLVWAGNWEQAIETGTSRLADLKKKKKEKAKIEGALAAVVVAQKTLLAAEGALADFWEKLGGERDLKAMLEVAQKQHEKKKAELKAQNRVAALLDLASKQIEESDAACPVCESTVPDLKGKVDMRLQEVSSEVIEKIREELEQLQEKVTTLEKQVQKLNGLEKAFKNAQEYLSITMEEMRVTLPNPEGADPVAAANARLEKLEEEISELLDIFDKRKEYLMWHNSETRKLEAMHRYLVELEKASEQVDLSQEPEWQTWQKAVDELAALVVDAEALGKHALAVQAEMTGKSETSVNRTLGKYYDLIVGKDSSSIRGMRIKSRATATRITYKVQDDQKNDLVPILNQAALNALSLAILFSQAEARAAQGSLGVLILDDPQQSLDENHVGGLVKALEEIVEHDIPVLVGTVPGSLESRIQNFAACGKNFIKLLSWNPGTGAQVEASIV